MSDSEASPAPNYGRCIYGFVLYIISYTLLIFFLLSLLPESMLQRLELWCLPHKYWYLSLSSLLFVAIVAFGSIIYPLIIFSLTEKPNSLSLFKDKHSYYFQDTRVTGDEKNKLAPIYDIPLEEITRTLYFDPKLVNYDREFTEDG